MRYQEKSNHKIHKKKHITSEIFSLPNQKEHQSIFHSSLKLHDKQKDVKTQSNKFPVSFFPSEVGSSP